MQGTLSNPTFEQSLTTLYLTARPATHISNQRMIAKRLFDCGDFARILQEPWDLRQMQVAYQVGVGPAHVPCSINVLASQRMGSFVITDQISSKSQIHHIMKPIISLNSSVLKGASTRQGCAGRFDRRGQKTTITQPNNPLLSHHRHRAALADHPVRLTQVRGSQLLLPAVKSCFTVPTCMYWTLYPQQYLLTSIL